MPVYRALMFPWHDLPVDERCGDIADERPRSIRLETTSVGSANGKIRDLRPSHCPTPCRMTSHSSTAEPEETSPSGTHAGRSASRSHPRSPFASHRPSCSPRDAGTLAGPPRRSPRAIASPPRRWRERAFRPQQVLCSSALRLPTHTRAVLSALRLPTHTRALLICASGAHLHPRGWT